MFGSTPSRICDYTVRCKGCGENVPAPVETLPDSWIVTECAVCGQRRRYLPSEIFRGRLSNRASAVPTHPPSTRPG